MIYVLFILISLTLILWVIQLLQLIKDEIYYARLLKSNSPKGLSKKMNIS